MARFPSVGEDFAGYRLTRQLGRGGMGVVFAADHLALGRAVALKVLAPELATRDDYRTRFIREAGVLARLDSPHVVQVVDHGESEGCLYIATQYVAGGDLAEALHRHGPMPVAQAAQLAEQVAWALSDSHAAGVVHRDVKPSNVLLREISSEVFVYLCDFGIAQDRDAGLTAPGAVAGTFSYLAPERLQGQPATASTDLYALGCVLFGSLVGAAPYAGSDVQIGMSHLNAPVPQILESSPVAAAVNAVLRRSMAKDPAHRYPDALTMRAELRRLATLARTTPHPPLVPQTPLSGAGPGLAAPAGPTRPSRPPAPPPRGPAPSVAPAFPQPVPAPSWAPPSQPPRRRRTALVVAAAVAAAVSVLVGVAVVVVATGDDDEPEARGSAAATTGPTTEPTTPEPTTPEPTTPEPTTAAATTTAPPDPPEPPDPEPKPRPRPTYPQVPAATGVPVSLGPASLRAPAGWETIDSGIVDSGVGARDYSDLEGYYSSVFIRRSNPGVRLDSIPLLEVAAQSLAEALDENDDSIALESSELLPTAWLDDQRAVRTRSTYYAPGDDLYFSEEVWYTQRGRFLYRITFQHSKIDSLAERRAQIDPMVVSFRWS